MTSEVGAVVLVGGASKRMGTDKARLVVDGVSMVERAVEAVRGAGASRIVVAGPDPGGLDAAIQVLGDPGPSRQGPLAGVVSALRGAEGLGESDPIVVLSCDLPAIGAEQVSALIEAARRHDVGAWAHDGERPQPLVAAYRRQTLEHAAARFDDGERSLRRVLIDHPPVIAVVERLSVVDADTPADLAGFDVIWPD